MKKYAFLAVLVAFSLLAGSAFLNGSPAAGQARTDQAALEEWRGALARQSDLGEREKELVAELLAWDVKIEAARGEQERLRREIPEVERSLVAAREGLADTRAQMDQGQERLGRWVNVLYRYGPVSYLEVILAATDFHDFVERAAAVRIVINTQAEILEELRVLDARLQEQVLALGKAQEELAAKSSRLAESLKDMEGVRAGREEFLAGLRGHSAELAGRIVRVETLLWRSLDSLHYLMAHLDQLPWYSLEPDSFSLVGARMRLEFSDGRVNKVLFEEQGDAALAGLTVRSLPGLYTISGRTRTGTDFVLGGGFVQDGEGKVRFQPESVRLAGVSMSREVLRHIASEGNMSMDFEIYLPGYHLSEVRPEEGKLVVILAR